MSPKSWNLERVASGLFVFLAVLVSLYWAKAVLIPVALAVILTFLLAPVVSVIERLGFWRVPAVLLVVALVFSALGGAGYGIATQLNRLARDLEEPEHQKRFRDKLDDLKVVQKLIDRFQKIQSATEEPPKEKEAPGTLALPGEGESTGDPAKKDEPPVSVVVKAEPMTGVTLLPSVLGTLGAPLAAAGFVITLVIFMLIGREDLRNRLIRLLGHGRLTLTTRALDDAGERISRYLLAQSAINGTFGLGVGIALYFLGLPYALLWAFLSASLRFIPYLGPLVAAVLPLGFSLFVFEGWQQPLLIIVVYLVLELLSNMGMEPLLYGRSAGVSQVALLIAIAFWTWLWGPIGLLLATPLTVCIVVLGRHVPQLDFISILLGDKPVLEKSLMYYQRLVAGDQDEALEIVEEFAKEASPQAVYDELLIPALVLAGKDRRAGRLSDEDQRSIVSATREILEEVQGLEMKVEKDVGEEEAAMPGVHISILGCPARGEMDELALIMLAHSLDGARFSLNVLSPDLLASEKVVACVEKKSEIVVIGALPPGGLAQARYLVKRLRAECAGPRILVGRWGLAGAGERQSAQLEKAGADLIATTLLESRAQILQLLPLIAAGREIRRRDAADLLAPEPLRPEG